MAPIVLNRNNSSRDPGPGLELSTALNSNWPGW